MNHSVENLPGMVGRHPLMLEAFRLARLVAATDVPVLVVGESGTGKELVAQAIHSLSHRSGRELVDLNCAALPEPLVESELFGVEAGAYTDARRTREGLLAAADGSTLLLDEVCSMPLATQPKLLRAIEVKRYRRVGGTLSSASDFRVIATASKPADVLVAEGRLREDLAFRLAVVEVGLPPLRERREDIPVLVSHFLGNGTPGERRLTVTREALTQLRSEAWPGNVRQLCAILQRLALLATDDMIDAALVRRVLRRRRLTGDSVGDALRASGGSVRQAARELGVPRIRLRRFLDANTLVPSR